jgi:hypothetical protein
MAITHRTLIFFFLFFNIIVPNAHDAREHG